MNVYDALTLAANAKSAQTARPATSVIHDSPDVRVLLFRIEPGQEVPVHTNPSTVLLSIVSGSGIVVGAQGERAVKVGDIVAYDPREPHGMRAGTERLVIAAVIAPRASTR